MRAAHAAPSSAARHPERLTVLRTVELWLDALPELGRKPNTIATYRAHMKAHVMGDPAQYGPQRASIAGLRVDSVQRANVELLQADMRRDTTITLRTRQAVHTALNVFFKWALERGYAKASPMAGIKRPGGAKQARVRDKDKVRVWTAEEAQKFLNTVKEEAAKLEMNRNVVHADPHVYALFVLALHTGMRRGELFALRWSDIDLERGLVRVTRSLSETSGSFTVEEPKTASGRRTVKLPEIAVDALRALGKHDRDRLVFCDAKGSFVRRSNFDRRIMKPLIALAEVPGRTMHELRHTHASLLLAAGVNIKVISERLGHADVKITLDTYSHLMPGMQDLAAAAMDAMFASTGDSGRLETRSVASSTRPRSGARVRTL